MVSAWADRNHIVPGKVKVDEKSNEIIAIPRLLDLLVIKSRMVTIDAMDCQRDIAAKVVDEQLDSGHGRIETRRCSVIRDLPMVESRGE